MSISNVIFQSKHISVVQTSGARTDAIAVTFTPEDHRYVSPPQGFSQAYFENLGIPSIAFVSNSNHWWQIEDMKEALAVVRSAVSAFPRVLSYGTAMGAYGALIFSSALGATEVLALAPLISRAAKDARQEAPTEMLALDRQEVGEGISQHANVLLVYDPLTRDAYHLRKIVGDHVQHLEIPLIGQNVFSFLKTNGVLDALLQDTIAGDSDLANYRDDVLQKRKLWPTYWLGLGEKASEAGRHKDAAACFERAAGLDPRYPTLLKWARSCERSGDIETAAQQYAQALLVKPGDERVTEKTVKLLLAATRTAIRNGDLDQATENAELAARIAPDNEDVKATGQRLVRIRNRESHSGLPGQAPADVQPM